ncbi:hypothetical protein TCAL_08542 [Tigriopus californicus]|uniref:Uncharacterized protein n=1 Tax=Tigriopus californicus TaxID=6832 RepID=A0A553PA02_TIGCA|nr:uncharacterized protein LOC131893380 [Tigriopus californicus]TRY74499.1 hypothetical protein TCAL_08542 [Tigriopus californicus]|eukprot:TCALIF_08542-PA protein Name:"Protein of unknown function" AED:0.04 eAED:0.00 QI:91/1/0.83/1/0.6/0.5/6/141/358
MFGHVNYRYLTGLASLWLVTEVLMGKFISSLKILEFELRHSRPDHPPNQIDVTFDQVYFMVFNISLGADETPLNTLIYRDGRKVFELLPTLNEPEVFAPFTNEDLTFTSQPIEGGFLQGTIMIHRPKVVHEGFYKVISKVIQNQSQAVQIDSKSIYVRAISNCTQVEGRSLVREPCDLHLQYWCKNPIYPLSSIRILAFFGSALDRTFAMPLPGAGVTSFELEDGRYEITFNYTQQELGVMPSTFYSQLDWYQYDTLLRSDIKDFEKRDHCNSSGTFSPDAVLHLTPQTVFPSETPKYFETMAWTTNSTTRLATISSVQDIDRTTHSAEPSPSGCPQMNHGHWALAHLLTHLILCYEL